MAYVKNRLKNGRTVVGCSALPRTSLASPRFRLRVKGVSFRFQDRAQAGRLLAEKLMGFSDRPEVAVLGLPRGGVPVAFEVAQRLNAPLDVFLVRKLGVPRHEELAMGAIATGDICFLNDGIIHSLRI